MVGKVHEIMRSSTSRRLEEWYQRTEQVRVFFVARKTLFFQRKIGFNDLCRMESQWAMNMFLWKNCLRILA